MSDTKSRLNAGDLESVFVRPKGTTERVGIEIENGTLVSQSGQAPSYAGTHGIRELLLSVLHAYSGEPKLEGNCLVGVELPEGGTVSVELGGALEYSSLPQDTVGALMRETESVLAQLAGLAQRLGLALVPNGYLPFDSADTIDWVPKPRASIMRDYYRSLGHFGSRAPSVMTLNISTQVTLDYLDERDLDEKLRALVGVGPIAAAIFTNSPIEEGKFCGMLSRRTYNWMLADPNRGGVVEPALKDEVTVEEFVDWALGMSMIFRPVGEGHRAAPATPFRDLLTEGFDDGERPSLADWESLLCQIWTDVRLRQTIELRSTDGPPAWAISAVPAFWSGIAYHPPSRKAAWELVRGRTAADYTAAMRDVSVRGLAARFGPDSIAELARELVRLAREGLEARVAAEKEDAIALRYLESIEQVVETGCTFAECLLERWDGDLKQQPSRYVEAFAIRPT